MKSYTIETEDTYIYDIVDSPSITKTLIIDSRYLPIIWGLLSDIAENPNCWKDEEKRDQFKSDLTNLMLQ